MGGEVLFDTKLTGLSFEKDRLSAIQIIQGGQDKTIAAQSLILAIGHSARDTFEMLHQAGLPMEQKAFSAGYALNISRPPSTKANTGNLPSILLWALRITNYLSDSPMDAVFIRSVCALEARLSQRHQKKAGYASTV